MAASPEKFLTAIDMGLNEILNMRFQNLPTDPGTAKLGFPYYNTVSNHFRICVNETGPVFEELRAYTAGSGLTLTAGAFSVNVDASSVEIFGGILRVKAGGVTSAMIADGTIVAADIATDTITATQIAPDAITASELAVDSVGASELADNSVASANIIDGTIVGADLANDTITATQIAADAVGASELADNSVASANVIDGSLMGTDLNAAAAIANTQLATNPLARANHTGTQLAATISDFNTAVRLNRLDQMTPPASGVDFGGQRQLSVGDPLAPTDGANMRYVDAIAQGIQWKAPAQYGSAAAATYTIVAGSVTSIAGLTFGGGTPAIGERLLIFDAPAATGAGGAGVPSTQPANGLYVVTNNTTNLTVGRAGDADSAAELQGATVAVDKGTLEGRFYNQKSDSITVGTTGLFWTVFAFASDITVTDPISKAGNVIGLKYLAGQFNVDGSGNLGVIYPTVPSPGSNGTITPGTVGMARATNAIIMGDNSTTDFVFTPGFGNCKFAQVQVVEDSTGQVVRTSVICATSTVTIAFATAPVAAKRYNVSIVNWAS